MRVLLATSLAATALIGVHVDAKTDLPPHACIVQRTDRLSRPELLELVKGGFAPTTNDGKATMRAVGEVITSCVTKYGWGKAKQDIAIRYFSARLLHDDAIVQGGKFAITDAMMTAYVASLDAGMRASYAKGQVTPEMNRAAFAHLQTASIALEGRSAEEIQAIGRALNSGVYAIIVEQESIKAYAGS
ncbi:MAG: hypothetical protein JWN66_200 [Sphingomonas bacterium]|uniref:hypothetical protein n=1 Tax=Sphingomonas bacterium TaxID=1895847 RepID=UPI002617E693|nr:hypothetical protein [Sphingomonas bacterium]MDB5703084.1 hypothetical protein [Sphingomonas bacterium]